MIVDYRVSLKTHDVGDADTTFRRLSDAMTAAKEIVKAAKGNVEGKWSVIVKKNIDMGSVMVAIYRSGDVRWTYGSEYYTLMNNSAEEFGGSMKKRAEQFRSRR